MRENVSGLDDILQRNFEVLMPDAWSCCSSKSDSSRCLDVFRLCRSPVQLQPTKDLSNRIS